MMGGLSMRLFLLMLLPLLLLTVRAEQKTLDMSANAVDDVFSGCRDRMLRAVTEPGGVLEREIRVRGDFSEMWRVSGRTCEKQIHGGTQHHLSALHSYGNSGVNFRKKFNRMVQTNGTNATTYSQFPYKSLHFLLTDAMRLLNDRNASCRHVYFGTNLRYSAQTGKEIRFGRFLHPRTQKSSEIEAAGSGEGEGTLFDITSCSVVNVEDYTCFSDEVEQLISPTEVFTVENVQPVKSDDGDYRTITLSHSRFLSNHDCYLFHSSDSSPDGSSAPSLTPWILVLLGPLLLAGLLTEPLLQI
ncbi:T-cell ecto-ADP-ribosyltransferase 1 [Astyanax mexicanus]|uniref:NAD(P)(+)--arginine ADP-ribosyltransferase n=1 Tax=Astyanax mexicanus TaxID=7994 RepID=A0A8T2KL09_ASTMX|nr:T-cell ecto-ADP-ribosyltransferase 1 [Astyanax mexicanus]KAG9259994.1 T-cell ecto-ADP-ribosyltransferase 1-like isoform X1 [Astyanax mexicanus]